MDSTLRRRLVELNLDLYERLAGEFSASRERLQEGIHRALASLGSFSSLADIGCGDGRVGRSLRRGEIGSPPRPWKGRYLGVDFSGALLERAGPSASGFDLIQADLSQAGWARELPRPEGGYEALVLFSLLHHLPGARQRLEFLRECSTLLRPGARAALSVWRFLHRERFRRRVVPWSRIGVDGAEVEDGDVLLDWRRGGHALRYVHAFDDDELIELCAEAGLEAEEQFHSDGRDGELGLYLIVRKV